MEELVLSGRITHPPRAALSLSLTNFSWWTLLGFYQRAAG